MKLVARADRRCHSLPTPPRAFRCTIERMRRESLGRDTEATTPYLELVKEIESRRCFTDTSGEYWRSRLEARSHHIHHRFL